MKIRLTPSVLAWLRCFEATVRCGSFTRAAAELCVTQGAVSQQVKQLESWLNRSLLIRAPRALLPTPEGQWLAAVLHESFQTLEGTLTQLSNLPQDRAMALSCAPSFALGWLTPRLGDFFRKYPEVDLRVIGEFHLLDRQRMAQDGVAAAVRYDLGEYTDLQASVFLDEWLLPVASPCFLAAQPQLRSPADLSASMLLHDAAPWVAAGAFEEWTQWFDQVGVAVPDIERGRQYNLSQLALGAARAGQGVAMGRLALVHDELLAGTLVAPFRRAVRARAAYVFVSGMDPSPASLVVKDWLGAQAGMFRLQRDALLAGLSAN